MECTAYFYAPGIPYDNLVIDHFFPIASFDLLNGGRRWVNFWSNLRMITKEENLKKHATPASEQEIDAHNKLIKGFIMLHDNKVKRDNQRNTY